MELSKNSTEVAKARYIREGKSNLEPDVNWEGVSQRVAKRIASNEKENFEYWNERFFDMIYNLKALPGGRTLRNSGYSDALLNCHVLQLSDSITSTPDMTGIGRFIDMALTLNADGGGVGCHPNLRPKGATVKGRGGNSSGMLSFLRAISSVLDVVESGGNRRSGLLPIVDASHPEILNFIDSKLNEEELNNFNISVGITNKFLDSVEQKKKWKFIFGDEEYGEIWAPDLFDKIVENMIRSGEPGLVNLDRMMTNNSFYFKPVESLNLCITGETKIPVAGRGNIEIQKLAEEGKDIPVYCVADDGNISIQIMRHPRITGYKKKILKVIYDDGSYQRCNIDHKVKMADGSMKSVMNLLEGDSVHHMSKYISSFQKEIFKKDPSTKDYVWLSNGQRMTISEHKLLAEYKQGKKIKLGEVVHHIDNNGTNNSFDNLKIMSTEDHRALHRKDMIGDKNPMKNEDVKNRVIKNIVDNGLLRGNNNGRWLGYTPTEYFYLAVKHIKEAGRKLTAKEWKDICKEKRYPYNSSFTIGNHSSISTFLKHAAEEAGMKLSRGKLREYKKFLKIKEESDLDVFFDESIYVRKRCEYCGKEFIVRWNMREQSFCSTRCGSLGGSGKEKAKEYWNKRQKSIREKQIEIFNNLKFALKRNPLKKEWEKECKENNVAYRVRSKKEKNISDYCFRSYKQLSEAASMANFRVVKVVEDGYEDIYTGTVDKYHNFYTLVGEGNTKSGKKIWKYTANLNCGELPLSKNQSCCLGSIVLPNFLDTSGRTKWSELADTIKTLVRFLDNVLDVNVYAFQEMQQASLESRRIGVGVMGLADYLFGKEAKYGSARGISLTEEVIKVIRNEIYKASIEIAKEKGSFPGFNDFAYTSAKFIKTLPAKIRMDIKKTGIRNCTGMCFPPTGSISLVADAVSGIEPLFAKAHERKDRVSTRTYIHPLYEKFLEEGNIPDWFVDAHDLTPEEHFETIAAIQRLNDSSISKSVNLPESTTADQLKDWLLEYARDLIGITVYRHNSRKDQILYPMSEDNAREYITNHDEGPVFSLDFNPETDEGCGCGG